MSREVNERKMELAEELNKLLGGKLSPAIEHVLVAKLSLLDLLLIVAKLRKVEDS